MDKSVWPLVYCPYIVNSNEPIAFSNGCLNSDAYHIADKPDTRLRRSLNTYLEVYGPWFYELSSYRKKNEQKQEVKGHNHPYNEKCGPHCPRNAHYKGPVKKFNLLDRRK